MDLSNGGPARSPGGSVRRARQRAAGPTGDTPRVTIDPYPTEIEPSGQYPSSGARHPQNTSAGFRQPPIPPTPPVPSAQRTYPGITSDANGPGRRPNSPVGGRSLGKGPPPQRPPRPSIVPSMVDPSQRAQFTEQHHPEYWEGGPISPPSEEHLPERFFSGSSRPTTGSTGSSAGTIPEFPVPSTPPTASQLPRRIPNLGPPPSARKGGATFYPQNSFVSPILEEQAESHSSYASSHAMPASFGLDDDIEEEDEDGVGSSGRQSRAGDHDESSILVRKVSIGKAGKPALKQIKSGEGLHDAYFPAESSPASNGGRSRGLGAIAATAAGGAALGESVRAPRGLGSDDQRMYPHLEDTSAIPAPLRPSASTSKGGSVETSGSRTPTTPLDPRVQQVLGGLEKGGALGPSGTSSFNTTPPSMSDKGLRKPARLNLEAVKENDGRGSSSSLPELIKRATKLASNLDRGRTASRLGFLGMLEEKEKANKNHSTSRPGSISDIIAAFPSPSIGTPTGDQLGSRWATSKQRSGLSRAHNAAPGSPVSYDEKHRSRNCCGMPIWAFALLTIILILLIAAAVIIPVTLIVLPKKNPPTAATSLSSCTSIAPCAHGGTNALVSGSCRCICSNGFTGSTCTLPSDSSCTSTNITSNGITYPNATLGASLPRLLSAAQKNFSLPLSGQTVLSLFSAQNLTCSSENALVNFPGSSSQRRSLPINIQPEGAILEAAAPLPLLIPTSTLSPAHTLAPRLVSSILPNSAAPTSENLANPTAGTGTSNGIVFAVTPGPSSASAPTSPSPASPSSSSPSTNHNSATTPMEIDFAREAVLFIFQEKDLDTAVAAQAKLSLALKGGGQGYNMSAVDAGGTIVIDFQRFTINLGNGTLFGGGPS